MKENKDQLDQIIKSEYDRIARDEEADIQCDEDIQVPEGMQDIIRERLDNQIKELEEEKAYFRLSEDDRKALELGRKMLAKEKKEENTVKIVRKKKSLKVYIGLVAVLIIVLGVGMTSMGGPERVVKLVKQVVGSREVEKINSSEDNLIIVREDEEEAYQAISNMFGTEPVRIIHGLVDIKFQSLNLDEELQLAEMIYTIDGENIVYLINASYSDTAWGIDVEDEKVDQYVIENGQCSIIVKKYRTRETARERYSASFEYYGLRYFIMGTMEEEEFDRILNDLHFF